MKIRILIFCILLSVIVGLLWEKHMSVYCVNIELPKEASVCFVRGKTDCLQYLEYKEVELLRAILNGKKTYKDNLSCGFSESVSIKFDNEQTFCIAQDTCPIIYWKEKDRYIKLSEDEKTQLYNLLEPYGVSFPCV